MVSPESLVKQISLFLSENGYMNLPKKNTKLNKQLIKGIIKILRTEQPDCQNNDSQQKCQDCNSVNRMHSPDVFVGFVTVFTGGEQTNHILNDTFHFFLLFCEIQGFENL